MKTVLAILMFGVLSINAQNILNLPYHPLRKIGDKYYSLQPIYDWINLPRTETSQRPMQEWVGVPEYKRYAVYYKVQQVLPEGLILKSSGEYIDGFAGAHDPDDFEPQPILLRNYPNADNLVDGQIIHFLAIREGSFQYTATDGGISTVAAYDYGAPFTPPPPKPLTPEEIAIAKAKADVAKKSANEKALKYNQDLANKGDSYGELRMGERYLKGDGVETNLTLATEWLQKAAAQGDLEASNKLAELK